MLELHITSGIVTDRVRKIALQEAGIALIGADRYAAYLAYKVGATDWTKNVFAYAVRQTSRSLPAGTQFELRVA